MRDSTALLPRPTLRQMRNGAKRLQSLPIIRALIEGFISYLFKPLMTWVVWPVVEPFIRLERQMVTAVRFVGGRNGVATAGGVQVRMRLRPEPYQVIMAILASAATLIRGEYLFVGIAWAALVIFVGLESVFIRVSADQRGVRVQNWLPESISWSQVADIKILRPSIWGQSKVEITLKDGRRVRPWAAKAGYKSGHDYGDIDRLVRRLLMIRREALGISDPPELAQALAAAKAGDPEPLDGLLATGVIDGTLYEERLHELADRRELDLGALRRRRREVV